MFNIYNTLFELQGRIFRHLTINEYTVITNRLIKIFVLSALYHDLFEQGNTGH